MKMLSTILALFIAGQAMASELAEESKRYPTFGLYGKKQDKKIVYREDPVYKALLQYLAPDPSMLVSTYAVDENWYVKINESTCRIDALHCSPCAEVVEGVVEQDFTRWRSQMRSYLGQIFSTMVRSYEPSDAMDFQKHYIASLHVMLNMLERTQFAAEKAMDLAKPWIHHADFEKRKAVLLGAAPELGGRFAKGESGEYKREGSITHMDCSSGLHEVLVTGQEPEFWEYRYYCYHANQELETALEKLAKAIERTRVNIALPHPAFSEDTMARVAANRADVLNPRIAFPDTNALAKEAVSQLDEAFASVLPVVEVFLAKSSAKQSDQDHRRWESRALVWPALYGPYGTTSNLSKIASDAAWLGAFRHLIKHAAVTWPVLYKIAREELERKPPPASKRPFRVPELSPSQGYDLWSELHPLLEEVAWSELHPLLEEVAKSRS